MWFPQVCGQRVTGTLSATLKAGPAGAGPTLKGKFNCGFREPGGVQVIEFTGERQAATVQSRQSRQSRLQLAAND